VGFGRAYFLAGSGPRQPRGGMRSLPPRTGGGWGAGIGQLARGGVTPPRGECDGFESGRGRCARSLGHAGLAGRLVVRAGDRAAAPRRSHLSRAEPAPVGAGEDRSEA
jgi:hypothetical protein